MTKKDLLFFIIIIAIVVGLCGIEIWYTQAVATSEAIPAWLKVFLLR